MNRRARPFRAALHAAWSASMVWSTALPAGAAEPVAPVAPVAPAAPAEPLAPSAPVAPAAPTAPVDPVAPAELVAPAAPVASAAPAAPVAPVAGKLALADQLAEEFRENTETRDQRQEKYVTERTEQVLKNFVDIGGYFRAGYGRSAAGGLMAPFQAPGAATKYRLGNEAENYGELIIGKNFYLPGVFNLGDAPPADGTLKGPIARVQVRLSFFNPYSAYGSSDATSVGLPEAWASVGHVFPFAPSVKFWAGNRFYRRHDIHVTDFFFWNTSGGGGGIEDVPLGPAYLALAWIGWGSTSGLTYVPTPDPANRAGFTKSTWDLRAYDVPILGGQAEFGLAFSNASSGVDQQGRSGPTNYGFAGAIVHTVSGFISHDGVQKFTAQYGTGPARTFTAGFETITLPQGSFIEPDANSDTRLRLTESFTANLGEYFSLGPVLVYQLSRQGSPKKSVNWISAGARPIVHFTRQVSLAFEGGVDWVKDDAAGTAGTVTKITAAPQVSLDNRWASRPVVRAFVTYAAWSSAFIGRVGGPDYATNQEGLNAGMQMEAWW